MKTSEGLLFELDQFGITRNSSITVDEFYSWLLGLTTIKSLMDLQNFLKSHWQILDLRFLTFFW